jgi:hypothetical protein
MIPEEVKQFVPEVGVTVEGITEDYVWYHSKILSAKMSQWDIEFQKLVNVMESRHKEHLRMIETLLMQNKMLRSELKAKNEQVKDA